MSVLVPAAILVRYRDRLANHNPWTLPLALTGPVVVSLGVVVAEPSTIDAVQLTPYVILVGVALVLSPFDPRLAIASTVAVLPLAILELDQELQTGPVGWDHSLAALDVTQIMTAVAPLVLLAIVAVNRTRAWERLHAP